MQIYEPTEEDIAELARDILKGNVYTVESVPVEMLTSVFLPINFMTPRLDEMFTSEELAELTMFGIYDKDPALPGFKAGYPQFLKFHIWTKETFAEAMRRAQKAEEALSFAGAQTSRMPLDIVTTADLFSARGSRTA